MYSKTRDPAKKGLVDAMSARDAKSTAAQPAIATAIGARASGKISASALYAWAATYFSNGVRGGLRGRADTAIFIRERWACVSSTAETCIVAGDWSGGERGSGAHQVQPRTQFQQFQLKNYFDFSVN
jgi:hypothetical protein